MKKNFFIKFLILMFSSIFLFNLTGCNESEDTYNTVRKTATSSNNDYISVGFIRDLGSTTDFSAQVFLDKNKKKLNYSVGNVFVANHSNYIDLEWKDNTTLLIYYDCKETDIIKKVDKLDSITILYEKKDDSKPK